jgi:Ca2+-transporting ATPase
MRHGANELPTQEPEPLWLRFAKQFTEPLIGLLLVSAVVSFIMGNKEDGISIGLAVSIVVTVGFVQEYRSEKSLDALNKLVPHHAHLVRQGTAPRRTPARSDSTRPVEQDPLMESLESLDNSSHTVSASQLVPGDLIIFATGDRIPADVRIIQAVDLTIDESNLTGENEPVRKQTDLIAVSYSASGSETPSYASPAAGSVGTDVRLNDRTNIAFMGTLVRSGHGRGIVIATGAKTEFGAISVSLAEIERPRAPLQASMDRLGQDLSYMSFVVIAVIVIIGLIQGRHWLEMFQIGVSLAVAAIPEGLPIIVTVTLALGVHRMAKRGAIVRVLPSVETLGCVTVVCSDKTGTLTTNHMTVTKLWHTDLPSPVDVSEVLTSSPDTATKTIMRIGNLANNARLALTSSATPATAASAAILSTTAARDGSSSGVASRWIGQPTDVAILDVLDAFGEEDLRPLVGTRLAETPFSSDRKWMGVVIGSSSEKSSSEIGYIKGAIEQVLKRCDTFLTKDGREVILDEPRRTAAIQAAEKMASEGLRVLGFASGSVTRFPKTKGTQIRSRSSTPRPGAASPSPNAPPLRDDEIYQGLVFAGVVGMSDPPRKGVDRSIKRLMGGGVRVIMITGDAETTAVAIARRLGMPVASPVPGAATGPATNVLTGDRLDRMSEGELAEAISTVSIFARTSPDHKMRIIKALQSKHDVVAMTGDGVNDAPALKLADIGISMGKLGTDVAKEASDMILTDDNFSTILHAVEEGKGIFYNIQNFLTFQLSTSVAALSLVLLSTFFGLKNPLNPMQILWISKLSLTSFLGKSTFY